MMGRHARLGRIVYREVLSVLQTGAKHASFETARLRGHEGHYMRVDSGRCFQSENKFTNDGLMRRRIRLETHPASV